MNTEKTTLEVGDILYCNQYSTLSGPYKIERVTATQAIAGTLRFRRALSGLYIKEIGGRGWGIAPYYLETPEIKLKYQQQSMKRKLTNFNYGTLSMDQLERINAIISEPKNS